MQTAHIETPSPEVEYTAFLDIEARNGLHARVEVPLLLHALQVPRGGRVLPWCATPALVRDRVAVLWAARRKTMRVESANA